MRSFFKIPLFALVFLFLSQATAEKTIEINKTERKIRIQEDGKTLSEYSCALGKGGTDGKRKIGDNKTPEGDYRIVAINKKSGFHIFLHISYPNPEDLEQGRKSGLISDSTYSIFQKDLMNGKLPSQTSVLGGNVGIHGLKNGMGWLGPWHRNFDWTQGCIAVTNKEIEEIASKIEVGTKVHITK